MRYPYLSNISSEREMTTNFNGYDHNPTCKEGSFYDMKNVSTESYPMLSLRARRGISKTFTALQGLMDKESLVWVDNQKLYIDNVEKTTPTISSGTKVLQKMGAYIVIFPDKIWYNTADNTSGSIDNTVSKTGSVSFTLCGADGTAITYHDDAYYETHTPQNGDYKMQTINGKSVLSVYSSATDLWSSVPTTYIKISESGLGSGFEVGDGVKISVNLSGITWDDAKNIFVTDDGNGKRSSFFEIISKGNDYLVVTGILKENKTVAVPITAERKAPEMAFITECNNRLWGCSADGHEIYCCKLGDVKNWNSFAGISTDSWVATIGSDGVFTGAITYMGYPIFFKEDSLIRVSVSSIGAHSVKETACRGVELGSEKSLVQLNEILYYKSTKAICAYDGSFPTEISKALGVGRYSNACGGSVNNRYYINMYDGKAYTMFVYDSDKGLWSKEDSIHATCFARHDDDLYFVSDNKLYSVYGTNLYSSTDKEEELDWLAESGNIGFSVTNKKNVSRMTFRLVLEANSDVQLWLQYDSNGQWIHQWGMSGKGTRSYTVPIRPRRCDHYKYKLTGHGNVKVISITKSYEEGSDA